MDNQPSTNIAPAIETINDAVARLSQLSPLEYDQVRIVEAKTLGVRLSILDAEIREAQKQGDDSDVSLFPDAEPWPTPVNADELLTRMVETVKRFIVCPHETAVAVALWCTMTWFIDVVQVAPLAVITAPEKRCGKSMLLFLMKKLVARPIIASNISPAAVYRSIETWSPTLLIDEADTFMKDNEELRGLINSGHTRDSAYCIRSVGDDHAPTRFSTWGAKVLAGIGHLPDTIMDRAIALELRRKLPSEKVERIRHTDPRIFEDLQSMLTRFAQDHSFEVKHSRPPLPEALNDRAQDNWEPLFAIAMIAGEKWLNAATSAALVISGDDAGLQTVGVELLTDIKEVFELENLDHVSTADLIAALCADEEKSWSTYNRSKSLTPKQLAKKLKDFGIRSKTVRIGGKTPKGYALEQFSEAFSRYVDIPSPAPPIICRHTPQLTNHAGLHVAGDGNVAQLPQQINIDEVANVAGEVECCGHKKLAATRDHAPALGCGVWRGKDGGAGNELETPLNIDPSSVLKLTVGDFQLEKF